LRISLSFSLFLLFLSQQQFLSQEARLKQRYEHALRLQGSRDFAAARAVFEEVLAAPFLDIADTHATSMRHPAVALRYTTNRNLGKVCVALGDHRTALVHFLDALRLDNSDVTVALAAADAAVAVGLWSLARRVLEQALRLRPRHWSVLERLADVLYAIDESACEAILDRCLQLDAAYPYALNLRAHLRGQQSDSRHYASALALRERHDSMFADASGALTGASVSQQLGTADSLELTSLSWSALAQLLLVTHAKRFASPGLQHCRAVQLAVSLAEPSPQRKRKLTDDDDDDDDDVATTTDATAIDADNEDDVATTTVADGGDDAPVRDSHLLSPDSQIVRRSKRHERPGDARVNSSNPVEVVLSFVSVPTGDADAADESVAATANDDAVGDDVDTSADERESVRRFVAEFVQPCPLGTVVRRFLTTAVSAAVSQQPTTAASSAWTRVWHDQMFRSLFVALHTAAVESAMIEERGPIAFDLSVLELMHETSLQPAVTALATTVLKEALDGAGLRAMPLASPRVTRTRRHAHKKRAGTDSDAELVRHSLLRLLHRVMNELERDGDDDGEAAGGATSHPLERLRLHWFLARLSIATAAAADAVAHLERCRALLRADGAVVMTLRHLSRQWSVLDLAHVEQWLARAHAQLRTQVAESAIEKGNYGTVFETMLPVLTSHRLPLAPLVHSPAALATAIGGGDEMSDVHTSDFRMLRALQSAALARCELLVALRCATVLVGALCRQPKLQTPSQTIELLGVVNDCVAHPLARDRELDVSWRAVVQRLVCYVAQLWRAPTSRRLAKQEKFVHRCLSIVVAGTLSVGEYATGDAVVLCGAAHDLLGRQRWCAQFRGSFLELMLARLCNGSIAHPRHAVEPFDGGGDDATVVDEVEPGAAVRAVPAPTADGSDDEAAQSDEASGNDARGDSRAGGDSLLDDDNSRFNVASLDRDETMDADERDADTHADELVDAPPAPAEHDALDSHITQALFCHYGIKLRGDVSESHIGDRDIYPLVSRVEILRTLSFVWRFGYLNRPAVRAQVVRIITALHAHALEPPARIATHRAFVDSVLAGEVEQQSPAVAAETLASARWFSAHEIVTVAAAHERGVVGRRCHMLWPDDHAWYRGVALDVRETPPRDDDADAAAPAAAVQVLVRYDDDGDSHWEDCNGYLIVAERPEESYQEFDSLYSDGFALLARYMKRRKQHEMASVLLLRALYCAPSRIEWWVELGLLLCERARAPSLAADARHELLRSARSALMHARHLCSLTPGEAVESEAAISSALGALVCDELMTTPAVHPALSSLQVGLLTDDDDDDVDESYSNAVTVAASRRLPPPVPGAIFVPVSVTAGEQDADAVAAVRAAAELRTQRLQSALDLYTQALAQLETWQSSYMVAKLSAKLAFARVVSNAMRESDEVRFEPSELAAGVCEEQGALAQSLAQFARATQLVVAAAATDAKLPAHYLAVELQYRIHSLRLRAYMYAGTCLLDSSSDKVQVAFLRLLLSSSFFARNGLAVSEDDSRRVLTARLARNVCDTNAMGALFTLLEQHMHQQPAPPVEQHLLLRFALGLRDCLVAFDACRSSTWFRKANFRAALVVGFGLAPLADELVDRDKGDCKVWATELRSVASRLARNRMVFAKARTLEGALSNWSHEPTVVDRAPKLVRDVRRFLLLDARLAVQLPPYAERLDDLHSLVKSQAVLADFAEPLLLNYWTTRLRALEDEFEAVRGALMAARREVVQSANAFVAPTRDVVLLVQRSAPIGIGEFPGLSLSKAWRVFGDARAALREWRLQQETSDVELDGKLQSRIDMYGLVARRSLALSFDLYSLALSHAHDRRGRQLALQLRAGTAVHASTEADVASDDTAHMLRVVATCEQLFAQKGATRKLTRVTLFTHLAVAN
jgi:tetratricopeptide (TPR) repeat protein